jgi:predicted ATPase
MQGQQKTGWAQLQQGEALLRTIERRPFRSYVFALLADAYGRSQQIETAFATVTEALTHMEQTGDRFWEAELYRLKGELTLKKGARG